MRSFWREQRMELGMLRPGGPEERIFRRVERSAAHQADAIITLAETAIPILAARHGPAIAQKCTVIPTCVDLDRFHVSALPAGPVRFLLSGTLNVYYDVPAMTHLVRRAQTRGEAALHVLSPDASHWESELHDVRADVSSASPRDMPKHVAASTVGLSVCRPGLGVSLTAAMPTKIGEFLASGRPVVVSPGIGDLDALLSRYDCGVVLTSSSESDLDRSLDELDRLLTDPALASRCRQLAEEHFNLTRAVTSMVSIYTGVVG
jgi:glycosyltransferase involved in cell wall biosynthesis